MFFKVLVGSHRARGGREYKKGETIESERNLAKIFRNKFQRVSAAGGFPEEQEKLKRPDIPTLDDVADKGGGNEPAVAPPPELGNKVTSGFPGAKKAKLDVYENNHWYVVVDPTNNNELNEKKLRKNKVEPFLKNYLED